MFWLKSCPKCVGDLHEERDFYGPFVSCIQCGYVLTSMEEETLRRTEGLERREPATTSPKAA